jgi:hypothetical protein
MISRTENITWNTFNKLKNQRATKHKIQHHMHHLPLFVKPTVPTDEPHALEQATVM